MTFPFLPFALPVALAELLERAYQTPPRAYHNSEHIEEVLGHFASVSDWHDPNSVALAILFHDAIYEAGRSDNEARSADLADSTLTAHPLSAPYDAARVRELILLTARHGSIDADALDPDTARFLDCDMAILGSDAERFERYEREIALEYSHLPKPLYEAGRRKFLQKVLETPRIYLSETFHQRLEQKARDNIATALKRSA